MKKCFLPFLFIITFASSVALYGESRAPIRDGDLSIHFLELGNRYTGDCVYINYGEMDLLIDAGSKQTSAIIIKNYIDGYMVDKKIEYVIATHAHEDHISGFASTAAAAGILESYEIGTIIDFPKTNSNSRTYSRYLQARSKAVENGAIHFTALECYNNEGAAQRVFQLGENVKLEILYNYFYENSTREENDYSVCVKIINNENQYLFTGDLEKEGEDLLVDYYETNYGGLGHCMLYKGGHHGSNSSSSEKLMAAITPEYVCVCSCVGSAQYRAGPKNIFPSQGFVDRVAPYTDKVYITTLVEDYSGNNYLPFNGNIVFLVSDNKVTILCSENDTKLKDTEWFKNNRQMPQAWSGK